MNKIYYVVCVMIIFLFCGCSSVKPVNVVKTDFPDEIAPVYCILGTKIFENKGIFNCELQNKSHDEQTVNVVVQVVDFSSPESQTVTLKPGESKVVSMFPVFNDKILELTEQRRSSVDIKVSKNNETLFQESKEITILATDDMIWGVDTGFDTCFLIASWVTPRDPVIGKILKKAKEKMSDRTLCGYGRETDEEFIEEMTAIWDTLQGLGISYVSSSVSFATAGTAQRVRLPRETITEKCANCVDGTVLLASIFENLEMEPIIVITEDHVFLGVRKESESEEVYYIETTMLADSTFDEALTEGKGAFKALRNLTKDRDYVLVDIAAERADGITPMPVKGDGPGI
ncbi:MAG: hypothetical protein ABRQ37_07880 [Candidatus Eremiobacterota bacterium]